MNNKVLFAVTAIIATISFSGCSQEHESSVEESLSVGSGGTLFLDSDSGSVEISTADTDTVEVDVKREGSNSDDFEVTVKRSGKDVIITGERERSISWNGPKIKFFITVPKQYNLDVKTGGGSVQVEDLDGQVKARTSGGAIRLGKINGDVKVKTSGGSITIDEVYGNVDGHTSGGSVKVTISKQPTEDNRLTTSGGSITAYLNKDIAIDLYAKTSGGRVRSEFEVNGKNKKTLIDGEINGGGPELTLKTSGGSVKIKEID